MGKSWPVHEAKARFSALLAASLTQGPQVVSRRGVDAAVLIPIEQWRRMESMATPSLKDLLLSGEARTERLTPDRQAVPRRRTVPLD